MKRLRTIATLTCLATLTACGTQGPTLSTDVRALEERAEKLVAAGEFDQAAQAYTQLINTSSGSTQSRFLMEGARVLIELGNHSSARQWLARAQNAATPVQMQHAQVLLAEVDILDDRPEAALETLELITRPASDELIDAVASARGRALFGLGHIEEAVSTLVERELRLNESAQILENHRLVWAGLIGQTPGAAVEPTGEPVIDGWLDLQPIAHTSRANPFELREGLLQWQQTHPDHPAAGTFLLELLSESHLWLTYPTQIAILLPFSSVQQSVARAIRDGFMAAHLSSPGETPDGVSPTLKFYDTTLLGPEEAYLRAQIDGADFVVGPLLKPELEEIIGNAGHIPTLGLNSIDNESPVPSNLYQFALAPEDEAREVARHAVASGAINAVALIQNSEWGLRLLASFRSELESLGGQILQFRSYDPGNQDFSLAITTLLNIERSNQRRQRLTANLRTPLEFEPRRRQDVDVIFIAADASAGRLLLPQLRFHYAGDIPTYATSAVHENHASDSDLNGVLFPDTPWVLQEDDLTIELKTSLETHWPQRTSPPWTRFYGLGFDAYRLVPLLYNQLEGFSSVSALSGELSLGEDGRVRRRLPFAQFRNGRPLPIEGGDIQPGPMVFETGLAGESTDLADLR